jgi:outer membrane protein TolC
MKKKFLFKFAVFITLSLGSFSSFSKNPEILTLNQVVESAVKHYPKVLSHYDKIRAAQSSLLASEGFFDIRLKQNYSDRTRGYYDGKIYDGEIEKNFGFLSSKLYGGYRKSYGSFPEYEGGSLTNSSGEFRAGAKFSLLKDRDIDQSRLSLLLGSLSVEEAKVELENIKMEIARDAAKAYWDWVASGNILRIYNDLYELSLNRQSQLEIKSKKGDLAQIIVVENEKNLLKRKASLAKIQQDFEASSIYLSLFWRDSSGHPIKPNKTALPLVSTKTSLDVSNHHDQKRDIENALLKRPEIRIMKIKSEEQKNELKYAENLLKPQLDVEFGVSKDEGRGEESRSQSNNYAGATFSLPLQRREGKGKVAAAESKLSAIRQEQTLLEDRIRAEIKQIAIKIETLLEVHSLVNEEAKLAETLQLSEVEKFKHGASNFFLVNLREQDLAASRAAVIEVFREFHNMKADYKLAVFDDSHGGSAK